MKVGINFHEIMLLIDKLTLFSVHLLYWIYLIIIICCNLLRILLVCLLSMLEELKVFPKVYSFIFRRFKCNYLFILVFDRLFGNFAYFVVRNLRFNGFWTRCSSQIISKIIFACLHQNWLQGQHVIKLTTTLLIIFLLQ